MSFHAGGNGAKKLEIIPGGIKKLQNFEFYIMDFEVNFVDGFFCKNIHFYRIL